jgi:hypothetical protein
MTWLVYCTAIFPFQKRGDAYRHYQLNLQTCYRVELGKGENRLNDCVKRADDEWQTNAEPYTAKKFYGEGFPLLLAVVALPPLLLYGCMRGGVAVGMWVWRGFRPSSPKKQDAGN